MAINKFMRLALKVLSYPDIDIRKTYPLERSIRYLRLPALLPKDRWQDHTIVSEGRKILTRIYTPEDNTGKNTLLFFHGGGWVTESIVRRFGAGGPKPCDLGGVPFGTGASVSSGAG